MTTVHAQQATPERAPVRSLTRGQITVLTLATLPMIAVGAAGAIGTYANAKSVLKQSETALGVVAAGEGATLVAALVMIGVTMLGQAAPTVVRAALWVLPAAAAVMGAVIADNFRDAVIYALTPLAMTASAEGISFLARRIVAHTTGVDVEAQRRNAEIMRKIAYHRARSERHPDEKVRDKSALRAWKLMSQVGDGDAELGSGLITVQRGRLTEGADSALQAMLTGTREPIPAHAAPLVLEPGEPAAEPAPEPPVSPLILSRGTGSPSPTHTPSLPNTGTIVPLSDQPLLREPVLSRDEPAHAKATETAPETSETNDREPEPETDETEQQITTLAQRLKSGDRLTKTTAAQLLGVSPATAGRRLKEARARVNDGTGLYL